ncbi:MAG: cytochrome c3 family protein [Nitrospirota bacterium]
MCLGCHSDKNLTKQLENREILSLFINGDEFASSIHNPVGCAGCHPDISMENHPQVKKIKSKKEYTANASKSCLMCHTDDQMKKKPFHGYLITKAKGLNCVECHSSHYIKSIGEWKKGVNEIQYCLTCHRHDFSMQLGSGESLPLSVNESVYKSSVHGRLSCGACHTGFSKTDHPVRTFRNKREYASLTSRACRKCHTDEQLKKSPAHNFLVTKAVAPSCVECHGSHDVKGIMIQKAAAADTQYCLTCHRSRISMTLEDGETLSLSVNEAEIRGSVHGNLQCPECHRIFSKTEHPVRIFKSRSEYSLISMSEVCKRCHTVAYTTYEGSIHYSALNSDNLKAPACSGCHGGAHAVVKVEKTLGMTSCNKCHGDMSSSYEKSIHGKERNKGNEKAPICSSCHRAHDVMVTAMTTKIKDMCFKCHKDAADVHEKWLSNPPIKLSTFAQYHFDKVACAACHSPEAGRGIYLLLYDRETGKPFPEEEVLKLFGTGSIGLLEKIDTNGDGLIEAPELWNMVKELNGKGAKVTFKGVMDVRKATEAHLIDDKAGAVKNCEQCHQPGSEFFKDVFVAIGKRAGKPVVFRAKQDVIGSVFSILPVRFYALGSTNVRLLDILFIVAILGGIAVPIGHITLRIITSPLRALRRMGKGGKK